MDVCWLEDDGKEKIGIIARTKGFKLPERPLSPQGVRHALNAL